MKKNSKRALVPLALLTALTLSGCAGSGPNNLTRQLPVAPDCMEQVVVPPVKIGEDARKALAQHRIALAMANANLKCSKEWYLAVSSSYEQQ